MAGRTKKKLAVSDHRREVWSFFTGAMGLDLGLEAAGLQPTLANELDPVFCATIRRNRPAIDLIEGDVAGLDAIALRARRRFEGEVYLMVGGPPCQPFSSGGRRAALRDPRGNLIYEYLRLIDEVRPRYFVLENVANLTTAALRHRPINLRPGKHWSLKRYEQPRLFRVGDAPALEPDEMAGSALKRIVSDIVGLGYHASLQVVDAADYGVAQHRLRFVMLGSRNEPPPVMSPPTHGAGLKPFATLREAIGELEVLGPHSVYTPDVRRFFALVPAGGNWRSLPLELQRVALSGAYESGGGKTGFFRRLAWDRPAPTITGRANRKGTALCHPEEVRPLSVGECAAVQGFPADWQLSGAMNSQYMQVGNAVPVRLGKAIGAAIAGHEAEVSRMNLSDWSPDYEAMTASAIHRLRIAGRNNRSVILAA